ncbi:Gp15 family bacteriophage protein [Alkalicoccobacillus porphyridii]|uniref:Uncharacterized protein n=1 Tax=Alkalicoccobacillus porphyridii TaxID=2597270 RepID=A0A554A098_9BACI|nr:Gp15 family bacteriophage protein [Alkalicoccobacillus porphyridii]TSB47124.1 hypothetical protein FN960_08910 [Alkalicoccobacillus porphyridii]
MRLNDPLVTSFDYNEVKYNIDLAFDTILDVFEVLTDKDLLDYEKAETCLALLIDDELAVDPEDDSYTRYVIDLWNYIFDEFIHTEQKQVIEYDLLGNPLEVEEEEEEQEKLMDLEQDSEFIFSSFLQAYGLNLHEAQGKLQWREFQALLNGLPSDTILKRIIEIRAYEPSSHDTAEYKMQMEKLQKRFALHDVEEEEED